MGAVWGRRIAGVEDIDIQANSAYRYPPKSGNYFASHFFMGGEKFETPHPEGYLFGENTDLNFLGNRPVQFPYLTPAPHEPVKTLRSLVNIRKDSLRLIRYKEGADSPLEDGGKPRVLYGLEFTFDADARVAITVYTQAGEEFVGGMAVYSPRSPALQSQTVYYKRGLSQHFSMPAFKIDFSDWKDEELNFDLDKGVIPLVIQAVVAEGGEGSGHAHVLLAAFEKHVDGSFSVKPLKQKQIVDRVSYLLQEIYGIENKNNQESKPTEDENSDNSNECVVCLSDLRDTLILPCRHLCLCNSCADTLRYQANNCPICRLPFRALLQIRAVRRKPGPLPPISFSPVLAQTLDHDDNSGADNIPPGFEPISLLEALNGLRSPPASAPLYEEIPYSEGLPARGAPDNSHHKSKHTKAPDSGLRSPSSPIHEEDEEVTGSGDSERPALLGSVSRDSSQMENISSADTPEIVSAHCGSESQVEEPLDSPEPEELREDEAQEVSALGPDSCSIGIDE
ncbi:E3 ubiquitin-protein ligase MGRN1 [Anomaloglossus baeobatrachus]|uniref:E3 ubiquitin-protein ligase MGRN1 n=1 Tax=Anomaloglossus baeobatrachus TaxID=238106 RepID=UPI003F501E89